MKNIIVIIFLIVCINCKSQTPVNYTASSLDIANPGRGFYSHRETDADALGVMSAPLTLSDIQTQRTSKNITLILRLYYLGTFKSSNISASYLTSIQNDLNIIRQAGAKAIIRFAYNSTEQTHRHSLDASKAWVLTHIDQLKNILINNSDVILVMQSGFIGTWGEWYYTHPDFTLASPVGAPNYPNRKEVSDSLLKILPIGKMIQLRTPYYKYNGAMYGNGTSGTASAITAAQAFNGSSQSRIGHHNDCFLASADDYGTYIDLTEDKNYLEQDTKYTFNGGEACNNNTTYTNCTNAQAELARFHYSYLNNDYNADVLNQWQTSGCFNTIKQKLGYRLELLNGTYTNTGSPSYSYNMDISLRNIGYAPPYERKKVQLILKNNSNSSEYSITLDNIDNRYWQTGTNYNITVTSGIGSIPDGTYNLYVSLKDTGTLLSSNPNYAIQFANTGTWDATKGYNLLKTITVNAATNPGTPKYTGSLWFGPATALPINFSSFDIHKNNGSTEITWTVHENNDNVKYEIERSENGLDFNKIGEKNASLNTGTFTYNFTDANTANANTVFYRIKIITKNSSFQYSRILSLKNNPDKFSILNIYPTPTKNTVNIELVNSSKGLVQIEFIDMKGAVVKQTSLTISNGYNTIGNLDLTGIHSGIYILKISNNNTVVYGKLIKQ